MCSSFLMFNCASVLYFSVCLHVSVNLLLIFCEIQRNEEQQLLSISHSVKVVSGSIKRYFGLVSVISAAGVPPLKLSGVYEMTENKHI